MNALMKMTEGPLTMSSREIADLCGKRHDNVMADCRKLADFYAETYSPEKSGELVKSSTYIDSTGRSLPCFELDKQASLDLVTGYSLPHRHAVNKRWQELERMVDQPKVPQTMPEALRLAAEAIEQRDILALENKAQAEALAEAQPKVNPKQAKAPVIGPTEAFCEPRTSNRTDFVMNATPPAAACATVRTCVIYLKEGVEQRTAWFTCSARAKRALAVMRRRYGAAVMYRD